MKLKLLFAGLLFAGLAHAQYGVGTGTAAPPLAPDLVMPAGKIYIDRANLPKARAGYSTPRAEESANCVYGVAPCIPANTDIVPNRFADPYNSGSFRVICTRSHFNFDDPVVWGTQSGRSHLHVFWGNVLTGAAADPANQAVNGNSTCFGGTLNRSGYWTPAFVYHCPVGENATYGCNEARNGEVLDIPTNDIYYKLAQNFHASSMGYDGSPAQWPPVGFRMISGNTSGVAEPINSSFYDCYRNGLPASPYPANRFLRIPTTAEASAIGGCDSLHVVVGFLECWDGIDDGSGGDHKSHVAPVSFSGGCTDPDYPIGFPSISYNFSVPVVNADLDHIRLSSDVPRSEAATTYSATCNAGNNWCAGRALHGDWVNGWSAVPNGRVTDPYPWGGATVTDLILRECYMIYNSEASPIHSDCHGRLLGEPDVPNSWWKLF